MSNSATQTESTTCWNAKNSTTHPLPSPISFQTWSAWLSPAEETSDILNIFITGRKLSKSTSQNTEITEISDTTAQPRHLRTAVSRTQVLNLPKLEIIMWLKT